MKLIPTTVFTGALGAGKTTIISNLVSQFPETYSAIWLKNEYGDVNVDSALAEGRNIIPKEILNGCLCCVLIGKLSEALKEIVEKYDVDRLIIETAGTAYPYPIVKEVGKLSSLKLDGLIMVIDALNFEKFSDKSALARSQTKYIDLIVMNKVGLVDKDTLDRVEDEVFEIYSGVPKIYTEDGNIDKSILVGIDSKQITHDEIENNTVHVHHSDEVDVINFVTKEKLDVEKLKKFLEELNPQDFYRSKGIIKTAEGAILVNVVLGRVTIEPAINYKGDTKLAIMGNGIKNLEDSIMGSLKSFVIQ
jgi:G3E family GTPase